MDRRRDRLRELGLDELAAVLGHAELTRRAATARRWRRGRTSTSRLHHGQLGLEPRAAGRDLRPVRLLVDAALAARLPLEVLDGVRDVDVDAVDPRRLERLVEQPARRADERLPGLVLLVAGLLAHEHHLGRPRPLSEHGLRPHLPEVAAPAGCGRLAEGAQGQLVGHEVRRGTGRLSPRHGISMTHLGLI